MNQSPQSDSGSPAPGPDVAAGSPPAALSERARELFEEEWELSRRPFASAKHAALRRAGVQAEECPVQWLPRLLEVVAEQGAQRSADACEPIVRRLVEELAGVEARRAAQRDPVHRAAMDEYAAHLTLILQRVRTRTLAGGDTNRG